MKKIISIVLVLACAATLLAGCGSTGTPSTSGSTDAAVAETLHMSLPAVRYHVTQLLQKTGYDNRVQLIADLINKDFVVPGL